MATLQSYLAKKATNAAQKRASKGMTGTISGVFGAGLVGKALKSKFNNLNEDGGADIGAEAGDQQNVERSFAVQKNMAGTLVRIETIAQHISDNLYNIAGVMNAQLTSMEDTKRDMASQASRQAASGEYFENKAGFGVNDFGQKPEPQKTGKAAGLLESLLSGGTDAIMKSVLTSALTFLTGPVGLTILGGSALIGGLTMLFNRNKDKEGQQITQTALGGGEYDLESGGEAVATAIMRQNAEEQAAKPAVPASVAKPPITASQPASVTAPILATTTPAPAASTTNDYGNEGMRASATPMGAMSTQLPALPVSKPTVTASAEPTVAAKPAATKTYSPSSEDKATMDMIKQHEGVRTRPYKDSLGLWTVGVGHLIGDGKTLPPEYNREFTPQEIDTMFNEDFQHHKAAATKIPGFSMLPKSVQSGLIDMTFNMGPSWFTKWPNLVKSLQLGDFGAAVNNLKNSKWFSQVGPTRGNKIVNLVSAGVTGGSPEMSGSKTMAAAPSSSGTMTASVPASSGTMVASAPSSGTNIGAQSVQVATAAKAGGGTTNINTVNNNGGGQQMASARREIPSPIAGRGSLEQSTVFAAAA